MKSGCPTCNWRVCSGYERISITATEMLSHYFEMLQYMNSETADLWQFYLTCTVTRIIFTTCTKNLHGNLRLACHFSIGFMKKNLNFLRILSSDMSKFGSRLPHVEDIGVDVSALQFTTKASCSETANDSFKTHANISLPKVSGTTLSNAADCHETKNRLQQLMYLCTFPSITSILYTLLDEKASIYSMK